MVTIKDVAQTAPKGHKVLLIEQIHRFHSFINNMYSHPGMLREEMRRLSDNVGVVLINETYTENDKAAVRQRPADQLTNQPTSQFGGMTELKLAKEAT